MPRLLLLSWRRNDERSPRIHRGSKTLDTSHQDGSKPSMKKSMIVALASCVVLAGGTARATGSWMEPFGAHLSCAKFKEDNAVRSTSTVDINTPSYIANPCTVRTPPVLACQSALTGFTPP